VPFTGTNFSGSYGGYRIYRKQGAGNFEQYVDISNPSYTIVGQDTMYYRSIDWNSGALNNGGTVQFFVVAYNDMGIGNLNNATKLTLKDEKKPTVYSASSNYYVGDFAKFGAYSPTSPGSYYNYSTSVSSYIYGLAYYIWYNSNYGYNYSGYNSPQSYSYSYTIYNGSSSLGYSYYGLDSLQFGFYSDLAYHLAQTVAKPNVITGCTYFNEPMDTTAALTETGLPARVSVAKEWKTDERTLCFTFNVAAGTASTTDIAFTYNVGGLKDKAGNAFEITYGPNSATPVKRSTLDFRIKSIGYRNNI